ncbi:MAG: hypothetical protein ABIQ04_04490 [Candidatus Saccharimonadales bacterium]
MSLKQTIRTLVFGTLTLGAISLAAGASPVAAQSTCGQAKTAIISCDQKDSGGYKHSGVWGLLLTAINIMTAGIGILAVGAIAYGAVLYTTAGGSSEQTKKAITIITNTVIGLVCFLLMWAILNYLVPGGIF